MWKNRSTVPVRPVYWLALRFAISVYSLRSVRTVRYFSGGGGAWQSSVLGALAATDNHQGMPCTVPPTRPHFTLCSALLSHWLHRTIHQSIENRRRRLLPLSPQSLCGSLAHISFLFYNLISSDISGMSIKLLNISKTQSRSSGIYIVEMLEQKRHSARESNMLPLGSSSLSLPLYISQS